MIRTFPILPENRYELSNVKYGRFYNWFAASNANIAPVGYVVPTDANWTTLTDYITAEIAASRLPNVGVGNVLKSQRQDPDGNANVIIQTTTDPYWLADATHYGRDSVKLSLLGGGRRRDNGTYSLINNYGYLWSKSEHDATNGIMIIARQDRYSIISTFSYKVSGYPIRFMRAATSFEQSHFADGEFVGQVFDVDNNVYDLVKIGTQVWSVQNLATTRYNDGTPIPGPTFTNEAWAALETPAYCNFNNNVNNVFLGATVKTIWKTLRDREI
jgi:uncharacterized protein (TIGR02145 family)